jgi:hypothetical protein
VNQLHFLENGLNLRNMAAHPSDVDIGQVDAEQIVKSLVKEIVQKCPLS